MEHLHARVDDLRLDFRETRERRGVERVLVQEHRGDGFCDLAHLWASVEHHPERTAVLPTGVACALGDERVEDRVLGHSVLGQRHGPTLVAAQP